MGDFNFDSTYEDQQIIISEKGYSDIYLDLNNGVESPTMLKTKDHNPVRYDKIII
jgi:hypothetical protein